MEIRAGDDPSRTEEIAKWRQGEVTRGHRVDDDPEDGEFYIRTRRFERLRTILIAVVCSGLVALVIVYVVELGARNNAVDACQLEMNTRTLLMQQADASADGILGDPTNRDPKTGKLDPIPAFKFEGTPFADFKDLLLVQANASRRRSEQYRASIRDCNELFPRPKFFGIFG
jgi:hypothetical protein